MLISYLVGKRDAGYAFEVMRDVDARLSNRAQLITDSRKAYLEAVEGVFGDLTNLSAPEVIDEIF